MFKEEKGMTLVALVVAIVVLLALAATVVYLAFGENGVAAESQVVIEAQDKHYAENMTKVGLKAVRKEVQTNSTTDVNGVATVAPSTATEKMELLIELLGKEEFSKESDTVLIYKNNDNTYRLTVNFDDYTVTSIE